MSDVLKTAKDQWKSCKDHWGDIYRKALEDLRFLSDEPFAQWDEREATARTNVGRPVFQVDQLTQYVHQVINDIRMNTPSINIIPADDQADPETAQVIEGRIRAIEYESQASSAYDLAADFAIKSSIGFLRVDHDYTTKDGFEQKLVIKRVVNPQAVMIDPNSIEPDGCDAMYGFYFDDWPLKDFKKKYPKATAISFGEESPNKPSQENDKVTIAEYFVIDESDESIGLLEDGTTEPMDEKKNYKSKRTVKKRVVNRYLLAGEDVLETTTFPGDYIPLVPVYGEEAWLEGKRRLLSLIRKAKSPATMYNMLKSSETEILLKQQQAPVQAAVGQMRGFEDDWKKPEKAMVLYYHQTDAAGQQAPAPQRLAPPVVSSGFANASLDAENNIKKSLGMYSAAVGNREGDSSGIALKQLDTSSDLATMHFGDNLVRSITQVGKILISALPTIEDTPRAIQTIGKEDETKTVGINGHMVEGQKRHYDFTKGNYGVRVTTGAPFTTQRQQAAASYNEIIKAMPQLMPVIGDLVFKYQDTPGSAAISARLNKTIDPKLLDQDDREKNAPDPQVMQLTQQLQLVTEQAQQQIGQLTSELQSKQADQAIKMQEVQIKGKEVEIKQGELQLKLIQAQQEANQAPPAQPDNTLDVQGQAFDQHIKEREIAVKEGELALKANQQRAEGKFKTPEDEMAEKQMEQQELQLKTVDIQLRQQQGDAIIAALSTIASQVHQLTENVSKPIVIQRDVNGNMVGAS